MKQSGATNIDPAGSIQTSRRSFVKRAAAALLTAGGRPCEALTQGPPARTSPLADLPTLDGQCGARGCARQRKPASIADGFVDASPTSRLQRVGRGLLRRFELTREPLVVRHPVSLSGEMRSHLLDDPRGRWHHTKSDPASAIDDGFAIHENFILPVAATDRFHLDSEFTTEPCRHTDGM